MADVTIAKTFDISGGIQWVVRDPAEGFLIAGQSFGGSRHSIFYQSGDEWEEVGSIETGESLMGCLDPNELTGKHPDMRRIYLSTESSGIFGYWDIEAREWVQLGQEDGDFSCGVCIGYHRDRDEVWFGFVPCSAAGGPDTIFHRTNLGDEAVQTNVLTLSGLQVFGPWRWMDGALWQVGATSPEGEDPFVHSLIRFDGEGFTPIGSYETSGDAEWSCEAFKGGVYSCPFNRSLDPFPVLRWEPGLEAPIILESLGTTSLMVGWIKDITPDGEDSTLFAVVGGERVTIYRSDDGINFSEIGSADVFGTPGSMATMFCPDSGGKGVAWGHSKGPVGEPTDATPPVVVYAIEPEEECNLPTGGGGGGLQEIV